MSFKDFSVFSSGNHFVGRSRTICAILVEGNIGDICVKLFKILTSGSGDVVLRKSLGLTHDGWADQS